MIVHLEEIVGELEDTQKATKRQSDKATKQQSDKAIKR